MAPDKTWRFIICVDVPAESLPSAYEILHITMGKVASLLDWESTDEAYDSDGEPIPEPILSAMRMKVLTAMNGRIKAATKQEKE